jgi:predicted DsbA family dithiol-disulfide isomerase
METTMDVSPGTLVLWSDLTCPWATLALHRVRAARERLGVDVPIDHRPFPLELLNAQPTPHGHLEGEKAVICGHEPSLGWRPWARPAHEWPGTVLVALDAVQAAKAPEVGGLAASEQLDAALRAAFFVECRPIGLLTEVLAIAGDCPAVDERALDAALSAGGGRAAVVEGWRHHDGVQGSPHFFCADGSDAANPGLTVEWTPEQTYPRITGDDPGVYDDLLRRAAASR